MLADSLSFIFTAIIHANSTVHSLLSFDPVECSLKFLESVSRDLVE